MMQLAVRWTNMSKIAQHALTGWLLTELQIGNWPS
jgi:hypothetical protein